VVISGGEPLAYTSEGKDILDLVEQHPDCLFLMFSNGTLIDDRTARRLEKLGNLTPALSVEGLRERTDESRGQGIFDRVSEAMARLHEVGVPAGISATITRHNMDELLSDPFIDYFFEERGAFYGFLFQYMPMGRNADPGMMPTPRQRLDLWRRSWEIVERRKTFLFDFWNYGTMVHGCVAAGRERGYMHIDWNGKVMPCVFAPYSAGNIQEVYAKGGTLNDIWKTPFFKAIRGWQNDYGYGNGGPRSEGNWMTPCPIRDHYPTFRQWLVKYQPDPMDEPASLALTDASFYDSLHSYGDELRELSQPIWRDNYFACRLSPVPPVRAVHELDAELNG
jgi:MoaA/NifB/PqqE/SkfB family radical SAM enzyme